MDNEWKVQINNVPASLLQQVFVYRHGGLNNSQLQYLTSDKGDLRVTTEPDNGAAITPLFTCDIRDMTSILKAFVAQANEMGFRNADETYNKGKIEAMSAHLEDMRTIVFEKPIEIIGIADNKK